MVPPPGKTRKCRVKVDEIAERLRLLDLSEDEAAVYIHMCTSGPAKAGEIATGTKLARPGTYAVLQTLVQRGFATSSLSRPVRFEAAPPEKLFKDVLQTHEGQWERIMVAREEVMTALETRRSQRAQTLGMNSIKTIYGRQDCLDVEERLLLNASKSIFLAASSESGRGPPGLDAHLELAARRAVQGIQVRLVLDGASRAGPVLAQAPVSLRQSPSGRNLRMVIVDEDQVMFWVVHDATALRNSANDVALWSDAPDFVAKERAFADTYWAQATPVPAATAAQRSK